MRTRSTNRNRREILQTLKSPTKRKIYQLTLFLMMDTLKVPIARWKKILTGKLPPTVLSKVAGMFDDCTVAFSNLKIRLLDLE